jgi:hypothetical protein
MPTCSELLCWPLLHVFGLWWVHYGGLQHQNVTNEHLAAGAVSFSTWWVPMPDTDDI